jgi:hypothetical protein
LTAGTENQAQGAVEPRTREFGVPQPAIPAAEPSVPRFSVKQTFASLGHRNYRLWFTNQAASLVGTWMQFTAQGFLVFQLTHSPAFLSGKIGDVHKTINVFLIGVIYKKVGHSN